MNEDPKDAHAALTGELGFQVLVHSVYYGENPRPATREEQLLWDQAVQAKTTFKNVYRKNAELVADNQSLLAANEAYREQLQKLHDFLAHKYPIQPTDDCIEYAMDRLVGLEHRKNELRKKILEIWQMPPGVDVFDFMLERLKDMTGENMEATEQLQKLYEGIKYIVHIESTDDAVEKALQLINVAHNQPRAAEATEQRRIEHARARSIEQFMHETQIGIAGKKVQE